MSIFIIYYRMCFHYYDCAWEASLKSALPEFLIIFLLNFHFLAPEIFSWLEDIRSYAKYWRGWARYLFFKALLTAFYFINCAGLKRGWKITDKRNGISKLLQSYKYPLSWFPMRESRIGLKSKGSKNCKITRPEFIDKIPNLHSTS